MDLSNLKPAEGSVKDRKRIGRGQGSGYGGTSTRGHKGAGSRSGNTHKIGFEGGQMPLARLVPKYGFKNINRVEYRAVNIEVLEDFANSGITDITPELLKENGFVGKYELVKILGNGELTKAVNVKANAWSKGAEAAITKAGGTIEKI
ncbi:MAG: 50S ribosomal protein L15 [Bacteroidales bacterium]|jgi:large subunit ribosomal protein L15|nr:50S ribosomal protein L15 [Bacteroidales bacterium]MBR6092825.1 50S ribosomal protein L15 [Bacteroidales bacterium]